MTDVTNHEFADAWDCIVANHGGHMTDRQETQTIYKYVMSAPYDEALMLEPEMLGMLKLGIRAQNEQIDELRAELDQYKQNIKTMAVLNDIVFSELAIIKPSWDDAPDNAEYLTQDEEWTWEFHENEPRLVEIDETEDDYGWWGSKGWCDVVHNKNWRDTLERRPEEDE